MSEDKAQIIKAIFQQGRQSTKDFIDFAFDLSEKLISVFVEDSQHKPIFENHNYPKLIMDKKELSEFLGVSETLINDLLKKDFPHCYFGRRILFNREEVWEWAKSKQSQNNKVQEKHLRMVR